MAEHYFSELPESALHEREISVQLAGETHQVLTAGGVFSPEHLDRGTEVLLNALKAAAAQQPAEGALNSNEPYRILDLGCGWGPIALDAALSHPEAEVWAVDVNERARALTSENARRLGLTNVRVASPEEVPQDVLFDEVRSNPPIRVGKQVLHELLRRWLMRLAVGGSAYLVVAKHLGADSLQRWLAAEFTEHSVERLARAKGFHVIQVCRQSR